MPVLAQRNFSGGEIAPAFQGRTDMAKVQAGLEACRNWMVEKSGSAANRAGFEYRGKTRATGAAWRLVPSVRDLTTTYLLELGNLYCRVWKGGSPVSVTGAPAWSAAQFWQPGTVVAYSGSYWWSIDEAWNTSAVTLVLSGTGPSYTLTASGVPTPSLATMDGKAITLHDPQGNTVVCLQSAHASSTVSSVTVIQTILVDPTATPGSLPASLDPAQGAVPTAMWSTPLAPAAGPYWYQLSGTVMEFPTPWADVDLRAVQFSQSVDVMTFCHPVYAPIQFRRFADTIWQLCGVNTQVGVQVGTGGVGPASAGLLAPTGGQAQRANQSGGPFLYTYLYEVTAVDALGNEGPPSIQFSAANVPPTAAGAGGYGNFMSWNMVPGAVSYNVYRQSAPGSNVFGFIMTVQSTVPIPSVTNLAAVGGSGGVQEQYLVVAVTPTGGSPPQTAPVLSTVGAASVGNPVAVSWTAVAGATGYYVYAANAATGLFQLITTLPNTSPGAPLGTSFSDTGRTAYPFQPWSTVPSPATPAYVIATQDLLINPDTSIFPGVPGSVPLTALRPTLFNGTGNYPAVACYFQQRLIFAQTLTRPEFVWMSQAGNYQSFASSFPGKASDAIIFQVNGYRVNPIRHMVDMGALLLFTDNGVYSCQGGQSGLTPTELSVHQENYVGCQGGVSNLAPIIYDNTAVYLQSRGTIVRSIKFDLYTNGFRGDNQSLYGQHLLDGFTIPAWTWAEVPNSTLWIVRSDGVLLGMTFIPEQTITGWSRHDTVNGAFEDVCAIPEARANGANEDTVYAMVRRVIGGVTVRTIERMASRLQADSKLAMFSDSASTYDGRNTSAATLTLTGGTAWDTSETLTLTASTSAFTPANGAIYVLHDAAGDLVRFTQASYANASVITGTVDNIVPAGLRGVATAQWSSATPTVQAPQLANQPVAILADGVVLSPIIDGQNVTWMSTNNAGLVNLGLIAEVVVIGLSITADLTTLDIESIQPGQSMSERTKLVQKIVLRVDGTAAIEAAQNASAVFADALVQTALLDTPLSLPAGSSYIDLDVQSANDRIGALTVRQRRPLPARLLSVAAVVTVGDGN